MYITSSLNSPSVIKNGIKRLNRKIYRHIHMQIYEDPGTDNFTSSGGLASFNYVPKTKSLAGRVESDNFRITI